jgi:GntR family transcriptional regulator
MVVRDDPMHGSRGDGLVLRIRRRLLSRIEDGTWRPGQRLASEARLAAELEVSRATLREALKSLQDDGFITRTRGAGTYLTYRPRLRNNLELNFGVTDLIRSMGRIPGTRQLHIVRSLADQTEAEKLAMSSGTPVFVIERVRTADGQPVALCRDVVAQSLLNERSIASLSVVESFYEVLHDNGIAISQGVAVINPVRADRRLAEMLAIRRGALLIRLTQVDFDPDGHPVLLSDEYHVDNAFEMTVHRRGPDQT